MPASLTDTQMFSMEVTATRKGVPVTLDSVTWESSDPTVLEVRVDTLNPLKASAVAVTPGIVVVSFKADKDPGDGVVEEIRTLDVVVGAGLATVGEIVAGTPVEQPSGSPGTSGAVIPT